MEISGGIDICQMSFPTGATAILLLVCMLSLFSTNCPNNIVLFACCGLTGFLGRISPCFQYSVQSLGRDRFRFISPYTTAHLDKRQKIFPHTDIVLHSANTSEIPATKKPHNYHKIAVWQKDDRIRKSPLKFCVYYYSELEGDCQASIIMELCRLSVAFCVTLSRNCSLSLCKYAIINHPRLYQIFVQPVFPKIQARPVGHDRIF